MTSNILTGYGSVFYNSQNAGTEYQVSPGVYERISRTAFSKSLAAKDAIDSYFNHDHNLPLGRTSAGTLKVAVDPKGLFYIVQLPDSPNGANVAEAVRRGDVSGSSFMFTVDRQTFREETRSGRKVIVRTIEELSLLEVGPVTRPAYKAATAELVTIPEGA